MAHGFPERDWKVFRELREVALERLCERALGEARAVIEDSDKTHHERFLAVFDVLGAWDQEIARGFDAPRRSTMVLQLAVIHGLGLLEDEEMARFSQGTREKIEGLGRLG